MALFHRNKAPANGAPSQGIAPWLGVPRWNYFHQGQLPFSTAEEGIVNPAPVPWAPAVTAVRGQPMTGPTMPANFPSPLSLFNGPRNMFS